MREQVFKSNQTEEVWGCKQVHFTLNAEKWKGTSQIQQDSRTMCHSSNMIVNDVCNKQQVICT